MAEYRMGRLQTGSRWHGAIGLAVGADWRIGGRGDGVYRLDGKPGRRFVSRAPLFTPGRRRAGPTVRTAGATSRQISQGCAPPLTYLGGPVLSTTPAGVTVTPIYSKPGGKYMLLFGLQDHPG